MTTSRSLLAALALSALSSHTASAQTVTLRTLIPRTSIIKPNSLPALHDGVYSGLGVRWTDFRTVLYGGQLADPIDTAPTVIMETGEVMPNRPDRVFGFLRFPTVWNGRVYFTGGPSGSTTLSDGTYSRDLLGSPIEVIADRFNGSGPWIELPFAGQAGLAYVNQGVSAGTNAGISLWTYEQQRIAVADYFQPMPDGSVFQSTTLSKASIGGNTLAYSARVQYATTSGMGVYLYDLETSQTNTIANMQTTIPGDGRAMTVLSTVDTDGVQVAFGAGNGNLYFGGIAAVCVANVDGTNLRTIVKTGDPMPGVPGRTFFNVGNPAVDDGIVYFQGTYRDGVDERTCLFAHANGSTLPITLFNQTIDGLAGNYSWYDPRGVDGHDVVIELDRPTGAMGVSDYMLVHAHINVTTCDSIDFNNDTSLFDPQDIEAFLSIYSEGPCVPANATCNDIDFNNDTSVFDPCDISSFLLMYSEGPCTTCGS